MRAIGGNSEAARRPGIPVFRYIVTVMFMAAASPALPGWWKYQRSRPIGIGAFPGYGFIGFLVAWLAGNNAAGIVLMSCLFAVISSIGDILQITQGLPFAVINILMA